jgi:glucose-1-phosphate cytidylyltransferase|tara:strand:- start:56 stop:805 length:750 start_codon:yes stop_codon:yes gene_type:complete
MIKKDKINSSIILVGGAGSRFSKIDEYPKQLAEINKEIIIIKVIKQLSKFGINYFIFPLGHKKEFFINFFNSKKNIKKYNFNIVKNFNEIQENKININCFNAGKETSKLNRILKSFHKIKTNDFLITYGDGLADVNLKRLFSNYFKDKKQKIYLTSCRKKSQYGHIKIDHKNFIKTFDEKPILQDPVNIGYYIFNKLIFNKYYNSKFELESDFLPKLIRSNILKSYLHNGYFFSIDDKKDVLMAKKFFK